MRIAALASPERRTEIRSKPIPGHAEWVWIDSLTQFREVNNTHAFFDFEFEMYPERIDLLASLPGNVFINSVVHTLANISQPFIRFNAWPGFFPGRLLEVSATSDSNKTDAMKLFDELGWEYQWVPDIEGMISPRIIAMIINEAYYTFGDNISSKEEIDIAMKLGTNYPFGPFEWSRKIGLKNIYQLLSILNKTDKVYRVSEALQSELENC
jgi:3-hydroxybutyryl-CoA dehydrogenase